MLEAKDIISMVVGVVIAALGIMPLLKNMGIGPDFFSLNFLPVVAISWILAVAALYLVYTSIIEITNSNGIGWISIIIAFVVLAMGVLPILSGFGIGPGLFGIAVPEIVYHIVFIIEGVFLMIAGFAMEM